MTISFSHSDFKFRILQIPFLKETLQVRKNTTVVLDSLTDCLEFIYQDTGKTQFYMDAREGYVYLVDTEEIIIQPEPEKKWSLYGED